MEELRKYMSLAKALVILERNNEAMGHARYKQFSDDELIAILVYRTATENERITNAS